MRTHPRRLIALAALALAAATATTAEAQGKGKDKDKDKDRDKKVQVARGDDRYGYGDRDRAARERARIEAERRRDGVYRDRRDDRDPRYDGRADGRRIPPGLAKKPGGMPPGQYKKRYSTNDGAIALRDVLGRRGYRDIRWVDGDDTESIYFRAPDGTIQRARILPGMEIPRFSNVPPSILNELMARLR